MIKQLDIVVLIRLYSLGLRNCESSHGKDRRNNRLWTYQSLSDELSLSKSTLHRSIGNLRASKLVLNRQVYAPKFLNFLIHGVPILFPAVTGPSVIGTPTTLTARFFPPEYRLLANVQHVWPNPYGQSSGLSISPLHPSAIRLTEFDLHAHRVLAAVDSLRVGGAREQEAATRYLSSLAQY